ncbi:TonB-dependent receptor plug domain-containing protein [Chryseobacterium sp. L7]|uniref:TonB-dependent receptor plug domain-containing protein n=1 Tax=Chryseobacterium endalhagicum TaxID=2797638 RepID=A0ABS1QI25_9FLAO|nr:TonB-dependent receptor [Chryseobacterium endalhagicum]MBL1221966.1 TonB-dependent receptor plug domain-containing protein [Chryseobacterium endalhagicum]
MRKTIVKAAILCYLLIVCFCSCLFAQAKEGLLNKEVYITTENGTLGSYLSEIAGQGIPLSYSSNQLGLTQKIKLKKGRYKISTLLSMLLAKEPVRFEDRGNKILLYPVQVQPARNFKLSGFVYMQNSLEALPYATLKAPLNNIAVKANDYGFYSLELKPGTYIIEVSHIGYPPQVDTIHLKSDQVHDFHLKGEIQLEEVKILSRQNSFRDPHAVNLKENPALPFTLGQQDPLKALQFRAGVSGGMASGSMNVRGGSSDQNLVLLDGAPVYNYNHFTGLLSIFNPDIVKHIDFYKGSFPSRYEGRLSSVIDIKTKEGNMQEYHGAANLGLLTNSVMFEGPIVKNKVSFIASARRSWIDGLIGLLDKGPSDFKYYLYDVNVKLNYRIDSTSRVYLSSYLGSDRFSLGISGENHPDFTLDWGNKLISARWNKVHNSRLFQNSTLLFSNYSNLVQDGGATGTEQFNRITDVGIDNDLTYQWNNNLQSFIGFRVNFTKFSAAVSDFYPEPVPDVETQRSVHLKFYSDNDISLSDKLKLKAGLHYTSFLVKNKTYHSFQPRTAISYDLNTSSRFFVAYSFMAQFYHQISLSGISIPNEFRAPSNKDLPPEEAIIFELGYRRSFSAGGGISIELYRKNFNNILMYRLDENYMPVDETAPWPDRIISGKGYSQGLEIEYKQKLNWLSLQANYTLSKTVYSSAQINEGKPFKAPTDLRNQVTFMATANLGKRWSISGVFNYSTGKSITVPQYTLVDIGDGLAGKNRLENFDGYEPEPNNYKLPDNYNLDLGAAYSKTYRSNRQGVLRFGINNVIGNPAPLFVNAEIEDNRFQVYQTNAIKILPYIGYSFKF